MRRISVVLFLAIGAIGLVPDSAEAQIFRRRARRAACCEPVCCNPCGSAAYGGVIGGVAYSDCSPASGGVAYAGQPYGPGVAPAGYSAGYPNVGAQPMPSPTSQRPEVSIRDGAFEPNRINVQLGDTVRWTNNGAMVHTVTAADGSWDSGELAPGKTFSHKFDREGAFDYHCKPHKDKMKASVVVGVANGTSVPREESDLPRRKEREQ